VPALQNAQSRPGVIVDRDPGPAAAAIVTATAPAISRPRAPRRRRPRHGGRPAPP
jgi:hypothetical protein